MIEGELFTAAAIMRAMGVALLLLLVFCTVQIIMWSAKHPRIPTPNPRQIAKTYPATPIFTRPIATEKVTATSCGYCGTAIIPGDTRVICRGCGAPIIPVGPFPNSRTIPPAGPPSIMPRGNFSDLVYEAR